MLIAEVASGQHPFQVKGQWLPEPVISDLLSQGPVDVSSVTDDRIRTLCQGLLTRRTTDRWGPAEVSRWLAGEAVPVAPDFYRNDAKTRSVLFNSVEFSEPAELAVALQNDWDRAQEQLIQRTDGGVLSQQVGLLLGAHGMIEAQQLLTDTANPPARMANLLLSLSPDLPPIYKGKDIRPAAILAGLGDSTTAPQYLDLLEDRRYGLAHTGVLTCWRTLEGMSTGPTIETRIRQAFTFLQQQERLVQAHLDQIGIEQLKTATYTVALNPGSEHTARTSLAATGSTLANQQSWWTALANDPKDFASILALHTEHAAREQTNSEHARDVANTKERERQEKETARRASLQQRADSLEVEINKLRKSFKANVPSESTYKRKKDFDYFWDMGGAVFGFGVLLLFPILILAGPIFFTLVAVFGGEPVAIAFICSFALNIGLVILWNGRQRNRKQSYLELLRQRQRLLDELRTGST
jgi:hypothetical protein